MSPLRPPPNPLLSNLHDLFANTGDYDGPGVHELHVEEDDDGDDDGEEQKPYIDLTPQPRRPHQEIFSDHSSSDGEPRYLHEARGMIDDDESVKWEAENDYTEPTRPSEESEPDTVSSQIKNIIPSVEEAIYYEFARNRPHIHRAWNLGEGYRRVSQIERLAHPPQLNPKYFRKHGFLYPSLPETPSPELLAQYTIEERMEAYKRFPIQGIDEWEHESPEVIDRWAQNKMAASVAQYWDETVKPDPWLVNGYKEGHEKHAAKERETFAFLKDVGRGGESEF
ncbi:MAG: hypothetical protein CL912_14460 [Deltaproteobacteria bacterium]|nr:hypothetical protein [Deltaproteobacteria bacterium]